MELLKERYGKKGLVLDAHYMALSNRKRATDSPKDCLDTFNDIERHLRVLKGMGEDTNHNHLRTVILNKFPEGVLYELRSKIKIDEANVGTIRENLEHIITAKLCQREFHTREPVSIEALQVRSSPQKNQREERKHHLRKQERRNNPFIKRRASSTMAVPERKEMKLNLEYFVQAIIIMISAGNHLQKGRPC